MNKELAKIEGTVAAYDKYLSLTEALASAKELFQEADDTEMKELAREEMRESEAALAELQRKLHATRTRHQNDARTLHQSHVLAITTMGAELEKEATTLWEHANLPIHHMPRLKGFTLPLAPKSAVLGASTMPPQASALSSANSAAAAQAAAAHAAAAHAAAAAAGRGARVLRARADLVHSVIVLRELHRARLRLLRSSSQCTSSAQANTQAPLRLEPTACS